MQTNSESDHPLLVADVGGTHARFAVAQSVASGVRLRARADLESRAFPTFHDAVAAYLECTPEARRCRSASFALAGPVEDDRCRLTNLGWTVEAAALVRGLGLERLLLVNDLEAAATAIDVLPPERLEVLQDGTPRPTANRAVLAPGTGFGQALLIWDGQSHRAVASEGGHSDFAPRNEREIDLWRYVAERQPRVSLERVLSGPGLVTLYRFLLQRSGLPEPDWIERGDSARTISAEARTDPEGVCAAAVALFAELLGAEAGNMVLKVMATGGIYLAGGVVHNLLPELRRSSLLEAFRAKGRHAGLLSGVPVWVVLDDRVGLLGAALLGLGRRIEGPISLTDDVAATP